MFAKGKQFGKVKSANFDDLQAETEKRIEKKRGREGKLEHEEVHLPRVVDENVIRMKCRKQIRLVRIRFTKK